MGIDALSPYAAMHVCGHGNRLVLSSKQGACCLQAFLNPFRASFPQWP